MLVLNVFRPWADSFKRPVPEPIPPPLPQRINFFRNVSVAEDSKPRVYDNATWRTSSHICFSRDHSPEAAAHAACYYRMLCVVPSDKNEKGTWYYLADPRERNMILNFSTGIGPHHVDERVFFPVRTMPLEVFQQKFPQARVESHPHFLFTEYNGENYGHFLTDLLFPIYTVLDGFDAVDYDIQLLHFHPSDPIGWSCDFQAKLNKASRKRCDKFYAALIPMLSRRKVADLQDVAPPGSAVCFDRLMVGASRFSAFCFDGSDGRGMREGQHNYPQMNCYNGRQKQLWEFRQYSKKNLGVPDLLPQQHQVLIWDRPDKRRFQGLDLLETELQKRGINVIRVVDWAKITIQQQLAMIGETTVHVTGVGGGSFIALHLPRGATTIRLSAPPDSLMEAWVFDFIGYVHPVYHTTEATVDVPALLDIIAVAMKRYEEFGAPFPKNPGNLTRAGPDLDQPPRENTKEEEAK